MARKTPPPPPDEAAADEGDADFPLEPLPAPLVEVEPDEYAIVTVYASVHMQCKVGRKWKDRWITVTHDTPTNAPLEEVLDALSRVAEAKAEAYECVMLGLDITAPTYYQYSTGI
jgi:hypothetical protein